MDFQTFGNCCGGLCCGLHCISGEIQSFGPFINYVFNITIFRYFMWCLRETRQKRIKNSHITLTSQSKCKSVYKCKTVFMIWYCQCWWTRRGHETIRVWTEPSQPHKQPQKWKYLRAPDGDRGRSWDWRPQKFDRWNACIVDYSWLFLEHCTYLSSL